MQRFPAWGALALAAGLVTAHAADPLKHSLVHGVFKPAPDAAGEGAIHPLAPAQKLDGILNSNTFRITGRDVGEGVTFPVLAHPGAAEPAGLSDVGDEGDTFIAPVDLTGCGVSDLIYCRKDMPGWKVLTNGQRMPKPAQAFIAGYFEKGADTRRSEFIPADNREFIVDHNLLAAVGDFLGNGTEQLACTRPGQSQIWIVGAHGVTTMKADLKGIEPAAPGSKTHFLFTYKPTRKGQRTRMAYYRMGSDHMIRLVPKGMEFVQERVPLKGNWERLNQAQLDWPQAAPPVAEGKEPASK